MATESDLWMTYTYLLAGEDPELAEEELRGFLESQGVESSIERRGSLVKGPEVMTGQLKRLALVHEVSEILEKGSLENLSTDYVPSGSFSVRAINVEGGEKSTSRYEKLMGEELSTDENSVDLETPDEKLKLYLLDKKFILCRLVQNINRGLFQKRSNEERPFSSPVSLDPVLARVLVNLSGVKPGSHVLDPFCGTGGMLIEAGLCGIGVHGLDIKQEMVDGSRQNLEEYGIIAHNIIQGTVSEAPELFDRKFDAVITDLPYGSASKVEGEPVKDFLKTAPKLTNGKIVFMSDKEKINDLEPEHQIYVHKNLTRYVYMI